MKKLQLLKDHFNGVEMPNQKNGKFSINAEVFDITATLARGIKKNVIKHESTDVNLAKNKTSRMVHFAQVP